ncbi:tRNA pseudouridine(55) synthase TruB [Pseudomonadota bacterium]|nr:tRNA pseudouridine(55) synthase TruB [Pseudomonadota bacterium]
MINGFLLINKDSGITSSRVVQIVKKKFNFKKVGHLGTLDPMAEGLLILAINRATKFSSLLLQSNKTYQAEVTLGQQTDTDDAEGEITSTHQVMCHKQEVEEKLLSFLGKSQQLPPAYSALKHKGKPMYKYAREGIQVDKAARTITIDEIDNISINLPKVSFDIACSKGTYIRSVARDLGNRLECGGHLSRLIRTSQEKFLINNAISIDEACEEDIIPLENAFDNLNAITLNQLDTNAFINGVPLKLKIDHSDLLRVYDPSKKFIAIGKNTLQGFKHEYLV